MKAPTKPTLENPLVCTTKELREHHLWKGSHAEQDFQMGMLTIERALEYTRIKRVPDDATSDELEFARLLEEAAESSRLI